MKQNKDFKLANKLWFRQGRTARAIAAYQRAIQADPLNPVIAFQCARVMWSVDRFAEAKFFIEQAKIFSGDLTPLAKMDLEYWHTRLHQPQPSRLFPQYTPAQLDRDVLESTYEREQVANWRELANAADERDMYGLAVFAIEQWDGQPIDPEDARELCEFENKRDTSENVLGLMLNKKHAVKKHSAQKVLNQTNTSTDENAKQTEKSSQLHSVSQHTQTENRVTNDTEDLVLAASLADLALELTIEVSPQAGKPGEAITLVATLFNPGEQTQIVNSRMLINPQPLDGEIWLQLDGPEGYNNSVGYRVNPGETPGQFFVALNPGQSVKQSWQLNEYHSLDKAGTYRLSLTYHNESQQTPDGRPMAVGQVEAHTQFILSE